MVPSWQAGRQSVLAVQFLITGLDDGGRIALVSLIHRNSFYVEWPP